ncbi:MAG: hypothetical protein D6732_13235 [Methanobacteriota archaeon]|nr:MAG: hypothetical protein D6732_13235 [Euryarchaeota archaeon]
MDDHIAVIGAKGVGKSQFIMSLLDRPKIDNFPDFSLAIWKGDRDMNFVEIEENRLSNHLEFLSKCSAYVLVLDPFAKDTSSITNIRAFLMTSKKNIPVLFVLNKLDKSTQTPNVELLKEIQTLYLDLKEKEYEVELIELSALYDGTSGVKKWLNSRRHLSREKVERLDLLFFKLGVDGPQTIYSQFPSIIFQNNVAKEEFIQNFMINTSIPLTQGDSYPNGVFILPCGLSTGLRAITLAWRMKDFDENRDLRLEQGLFFLSVFCPPTSRLLSYSYFLLESRFNRLDCLKPELVENPLDFIYQTLSQLFPEIL